MRTAKRSTGVIPSIKAFLDGKLRDGKYPVADALKHAGDTGRSEVTVRRMARELGYCANAGVCVKTAK